ncbi:MAG: methionine gamma-lyase family protein [Candidatus Obscuribacterales bacterium]
MQFENLIEQAESELKDAFTRMDRIALINQKRVLDSYREHQVTEEYFAERTGYGIDDIGREMIDKVFASVLQAEAAAVRVQMVSGTHAIACALFGNLEPGDTLVVLTGKPYDTLEEVIGAGGTEQAPVRGSLTALGVKYKELALDPKLSVDELAKQIKAAAPAKLYHIQKSRGYSMSRQTLSNSDIAKYIAAIKSVDAEASTFVDNCYGEFVEEQEPTAIGADLIAGSLIKNPGGGMAITGGYVAGRKDMVEGALLRLTAPGIGGHLGITFNQNRPILQGLFLAPSVVSQAVKGAMLVASVFEKLGMIVHPAPSADRYDIIQAVEFGNRERLINFCRALQSFSPVNAHVSPEPSSMPGYADQVVMAGGTFVEGATIELSADGPLRPPFAVYLQGGLSYLHVKCALLGSLNLSADGVTPFF